MLQVADATMHELVRISRHARREVGALHERDGHATQRRVPSRACAEDSAADDQQVEDATFEGRKIPEHCFHFQKAERVTCFSNGLPAMTQPYFLLLSSIHRRAIDAAAATRSPIRIQAERRRRT